MAGTTSSARWVRLGLLFSALLTLAVFAVTRSAGSAHAAVSCAGVPATLAPNTPDPAQRFTMLIRIQDMHQIKAYTNPDESTGGLADRIRPQDIFVFNTRYQNDFGTSSPAVQAQLVPQIRAAFPCNRIIVLNGMGLDPTQPGYTYALYDQGIWALMVDWEEGDWLDAQATGNSLPAFTYDFKQTLPRMSNWAAGTSAVLGGYFSSTYAKVGMVPIDQGAAWNYGQIGQQMDLYNQRVWGPHGGVQSVMTQAYCTAGASAFGSRLKSLFDQYKYRIKYVKKRRKHPKGKGKHKQKFRRVAKKVKLKYKVRPDPNNLAAQISFTSIPTPGASLPILATGPAQADQCVQAGLAQGAGAFFFYASEDSMRLLFTQPTVGSLRPHP